jgi:hypothetical protein
MKYLSGSNPWVPFMTGLLGIIIGGLLQGFFTTYTQKKIFEMNSTIFLSQKSQTDRELFIKQLFEYNDLTNEYIKLISRDDSVPKKDILSFSLNARNLGQRLMFVSNVDVGLNTSLLNGEMLLGLMKTHLKETSDTTIKDRYNEVYGIWLTSIMEFLNSKEATSIPGQNKDLLLNEIKNNSELFRYSRNEFKERLKIINQKH